MRLIDADELCEHAMRDKLDSRELIMNMIQHAPPVKTIRTEIPLNTYERLLALADKEPVKVLQEIRQEIEKIPTTIKGIGYFNERDVLAYQIDVLKIIDTHISAISRKSISDRDCEHCKHRHPIGCDVWECTFEPRDEDKDEEDNE